MYGWCGSIYVDVNVRVHTLSLRLCTKSIQSDTSQIAAVLHFPFLFSLTSISSSIVLCNSEATYTRSHYIHNRRSRARREKERAIEVKAKEEERMMKMRIQIRRERERAREKEMQRQKRIQRDQEIVRQQAMEWEAAMDRDNLKALALSTPKQQQHVFRHNHVTGRENVHSSSIHTVLFFRMRMYLVLSTVSRPCSPLLLAEME